jgi:hypothetical protein
MNAHTSVKPRQPLGCWRSSLQFSACRVFCNSQARLRLRPLSLYCNESSASPKQGILRVSRLPPWRSAPRAPVSSGAARSSTTKAGEIMLTELESIRQGLNDPLRTTIM